MNSLINHIKCYSIYGVVRAKEKFEQDLYKFDGYIDKCLVVGARKNIFKYTCKKRKYNINTTCFNHLTPQPLINHKCHYCKTLISPIFHNHIGVPVGKFTYSSFFNYDTKLVVVQNHMVHIFELVAIGINNIIFIHNNAINVKKEEILFLQWISNYYHILALQKYYKKYLLPELIQYIMCMFI